MEKNTGEEIQQTNMPWLIVAIPTVPRPNGIDYLSPTINALYSQISAFDETDPMHKQIQVFVLSHDRVGIPHKSFNDLKDEYSNHTDTFIFSHVRTKVVAQTLDVAHFLKQVPKSQYVLFMEDDFELCPNGFKAIYHIIQKSNRRFGMNGWNSVRTSFGLNGILFKNSDDMLNIFANYLEKHADRRPPDHLYTEFAAKETEEAKQLLGDKTVVGYRYNIFHHLGAVSTLRESKHWDFPVCWDELLVPTVFEVEAFNKEKCPKDDLWPKCNDEVNEQYPWVQWFNK
ncbi:proline tRS [Acrasis kona]|uniref:Proline tRS n=1 Tax=Acrasis kona TaxID=1008807 RepID=A0AAW2YXP1_9EUKA